MYHRTLCHQQVDGMDTTVTLLRTGHPFVIDDANRVRESAQRLTATLKELKESAGHFLQQQPLVFFKYLGYGVS